jgi:predicted nucleic acid-binding protein
LGALRLPDQAARAEAAKLGFKVMGTLALLNDAILRKWLTEAGPAQRQRSVTFGIRFLFTRFIFLL